MHTTSTRHIVDVSVKTAEDDGIEVDYLKFIIAQALQAAGIEVLGLNVSDDIGLDAEEVAFCHEHGDDEDFTYFPVSETSLRVSNEENNWEPYVDAVEGVSPLLKF